MDIKMNFKLNTSMRKRLRLQKFRNQNLEKELKLDLARYCAQLTPKELEMPD